MWNPVGVRCDPDFRTWGAPQRGDPRLCCETRSGLNHTFFLRQILHGAGIQDFDVQSRFLWRCSRLSQYAALRHDSSETPPVVTEQKPDQQTTAVHATFARLRAGQAGDQAWRFGKLWLSVACSLWQARPKKMDDQLHYRLNPLWES